MRSCAAASSSSAARLTAPSSAIALREPLDLAGELGLGAEGLLRFRQRGEVRLGLGELLAVLGLGERGGLFLELHVLDLLPRRVEPLLRGEARLLGGPQLGPEPLEPFARRLQRVLGLATRAQLALQRLLDRRPVDRRAFARQLLEERLLRAVRRGERLAAPFEVGHPIAALRSAKPASCIARSATRTRSRARSFSTSASFRAWRAASRSAIWSCRRDWRSAISAPMRSSSRALGGDLGAAWSRVLDQRPTPLRGLGGLLQLHELELEVVAAALLRGERLASA